jgi:hypothetical protein
MGIDIPVGVGAAAVGAFSNYAVTMRAVPAASVTTLVESANFTGAVLDMATPSSIRYRGASVSGPNNLYVTVDIALDARL